MPMGTETGENIERTGTSPDEKLENSTKETDAVTRDDSRVNGLIDNNFQAPVSANANGIPIDKSLDRENNFDDAAMFAGVGTGVDRGTVAQDIPNPADITPPVIDTELPQDTDRSTETNTMTDGSESHVSDVEQQGSERTDIPENKVDSVSMADSKETRSEAPQSVETSGAIDTENLVGGDTVREETVGQETDSSVSDTPPDGNFPEIEHTPEDLDNSNNLLGDNATVSSFDYSDNTPDSMPESMDSMFSDFDEGFDSEPSASFMDQLDSLIQQHEDDTARTADVSVDTSAVVDRASDVESQGNDHIDTDEAGRADSPTDSSTVNEPADDNAPGNTEDGESAQTASESEPFEIDSQLQNIDTSDQGAAKGVEDTTPDDLTVQSFESDDSALQDNLDNFVDNAGSDVEKGEEDSSRGNGSSMESTTDAGLVDIAQGIRTDGVEGLSDDIQSMFPEDYTQDGFADMINDGLEQLNGQIDADDPSIDMSSDAVTNAENSAQEFMENHDIEIPQQDDYDPFEIEQNDSGDNDPAFVEDLSDEDYDY